MSFFVKEKGKEKRKPRRRSTPPCSHIGPKYRMPTPLRERRKVPTSDQHKPGQAWNVGVTFFHCRLFFSVWTFLSQGQGPISRKQPCSLFNFLLFPCFHSVCYCRWLMQCKSIEEMLSKATAVCHDQVQY